MISNNLSNVLLEAGNSKADAVKKFRQDTENVMNYIKEINAVKTTRTISKDSLLQFPLLMDTGVGEEAIITLNKALEHEYITYILIALNEILLMNVDDGDKTGDILKKVHTNIDINSTELFTNTLKVALGESIILNNIDIKLENKTYKEIEKLNEEGLVPIDEILNERILNHYSMPNIVLNEINTNKDTSGVEKGYKTNRIEDSVVNIDYKKVNALAPTVVKATITFQTDKNGTIYNKNIIFGVKTTVHPVNSEDMIKYLSDPLKYGDANGGIFLKAIKFFTGEIKARDFFFNVSHAKRRAMNLQAKNDGGSGYWFEKLRTMAKDNRTQRAISFAKKNPTYMTAVTTVVITKANAERIKNICGHDIMGNPNYINSIMKEFFLMNFVVVDEPSSIVYIFDENKNSFHTFSLNGLKSIARSEISASQGIFK